MPDMNRVMIVADPGMVQFGYVERVLYQLNKNANKPSIEIFSEVEPDPDLTTVRKGVAVMNSFQPDVIVALGGGSAMDAAKAMWLFYEILTPTLSVWLRNLWISVKEFISSLRWVKRLKWFLFLQLPVPALKLLRLRLFLTRARI